MIRRNGARRRGRPGLELVAAGGLRLRARHPLVEPRGRDPRGRARRRGHGRGAHPAARADRPRAPYGGGVRRRSAAPRGSTRSRRSPRAPSATRPTATSCSTRSASAPGCEPRVISGREEARYGWLAIANSTTIADGFGLDIGGGSIQAMRIDEAAARRGRVAAARLGAGERGVPARGEGVRQGHEGAAQARASRSSRSWAGGRGAAGWSASAGRSATSPPPAMRRRRAAADATPRASCSSAPRWRS